MVVLPNVRKLFIPDPGYTIYEADLQGADAQVVAAEADDLDLLAAFQKGLDIHDYNATSLWGDSYLHLEGAARKKRRKEVKVAVHATNYGARPRTIATSLGWRIVEAQLFQDKWFHLHSGIRNWHARVESCLRTDRTIHNKFGYRIIYFDRIDALLSQALAWVPQSTVALVCFKGASKLELCKEFLRPQHKNRPRGELLELLQRQIQVSFVEILLQVHDSLIFQLPQAISESDSSSVVDEAILNALTVPIPYINPLIIRWNIKRSSRSWGDCT